MINDILKWIINIIDNIYSLIPSDLNLFDKISSLLSTLSTYQETWNSLMSVIFFIIGKPLLTFCISVGVAIILIKLVFAIINLVVP